MALYKKVQQIAKSEDFKNEYEFLCFYVMQGYRLADILLHLQFKYSCYHSYEGAYTVYRKWYRLLLKKRREEEKKLKPITSRIGKTYDSKLRRVTNCKSPLGYRSIPIAIKSLRAEGLRESEIARTFCLGPKSYRRLKKQLGIPRRTS